MIRITVEMVPHGMESKKYEIGRAIIANDGTGNQTLGNYEYVINRVDGDKEVVFAAGEIKGFRRRERPVWNLIYRMLMMTFTMGVEGIKE